MLLLELGQLTLDETCNISEPSIGSSGFLTAALTIDLSSPLPIEDERLKDERYVVSKILRALKLGKTCFQSQQPSSHGLSNPSWFDSSVGRAVV